MRKRFVATLLSLVMFMSFGITSYATETDEDLLEIYGKSSNSVIKSELEQEMNTIEDTISSIEETKKRNEIYNQIVDSYNEEQTKQFNLIQNTVQSYVADNKAIIERFDTDLEDLTITELKNLDQSYKTNISKMNEVLSTMDNVSTVTDYERTDYDLSDLYASMMTLSNQYSEAVDATEIGDVHNIKWVMNNDMYITSKFGYRVDPYSGTKITYHAGTDFRAAEETPIKALFSGEVIDVGTSPTGGNYVTIQSSDRVKYFMCHLKESLVSKGDKVNQYDIIALSGSTGSRCTGPHLHLALYINGAVYDVSKLFE